MKKRIPFIVAFLFITGLVVWKYVHRSVSLEKQPIILGHGGMGVRSPYTLNSRTSVQKALAYPIEGTEIDIRYTADEVLIAYHDEELPLHSACPGPVWEKTYAELYACSHGVFHKAEPIDALDTLLALPWKEGTVFSLDLKPENDMDSLRMSHFRADIITLILRFPQHRFFVESQRAELLAHIRTAELNAELFLYAHDAEIAISIVQNHRLNGISINASLITPLQIQQAQQQGIKVMIWGTGSVFSNRKFLAMDADIIQTDAIASMVKLLDR